MTTNFEFKIRFLSNLFFSDTIEINLIDMSSFNYLNVVSKSSFFITKNEIRQAIKWCKSNNASRFDDIFNRIFKILVEKSISHLMSLLRICATLNYHSRCFREIHIIALKKSRKKNYTNVKTYKSIAFLNNFDKILKSVIARRINDLTKTYDLLFVNQMNEHRNRNCETILKLLMKQIHTIWNMNKNKIMTLLNINVIKAYNHVSREKLLHNFKKRRISTWIVAWTNNFMQNRRISFIVKTKQTIMNNVNVDISQKSLMSSILYLFYNANLLKLLEQSSRKMIVIDFVNDINIFIYDINTINNCRLLKKMHQHCLLWSRRHEIVFASIQYELIHLTKNSAKFDMQTSIKICDVVKQFFNHVRVLNVQIDNKWNEMRLFETHKRKWSHKFWFFHDWSRSREKLIFQESDWFTRRLFDWFSFTISSVDMRRMKVRITSFSRRRSWSNYNNKIYVWSMIISRRSRCKFSRQKHMTTHTIVHDTFANIL